MIKQVVMILAVCGATAYATTLELRVVSTGDASVVMALGGDLVEVYIQARLDGGGAATSDGLSIWGANLSDVGSGMVDLCDRSVFLVQSSLAMANFDRIDSLSAVVTDFGLTNPSDDLPFVSGYSGTCDGNGGLLQLGGGQNTIGNPPGGAPYPIGSVDLGIANGGWMTVAEGVIAVPDNMQDSIVLELDTAFAGVIDSGQSEAPYAVTLISPGDIVLSGLTINRWEYIPPCIAADANCDGQVSGLDISVVRLQSNWQKLVTDPGVDPRADVNRDGQVTGLDISAIRWPFHWMVQTGPCSCQ